MHKLSTTPAAVQKNNSMYKIINDTVSPELKNDLLVSIVDIQLVSDVIANDELYTLEKSKLKDGELDTYTYIPLSELISKEQLLKVHQFILFLLSKLSNKSRFLCFIGGLVSKDIKTYELENYFTIQAYHEELQINGEVTITDVGFNNLEYILENFIGKFDILKALALNSDSINSIFSELNLSEPVPNTDLNSFFQQPNFKAIKAALNHGIFFFEEINNGTRLRISSSVMKQSDLIQKITATIGEYNLISP